MCGVELTEKPLPAVSKIITQSTTRSNKLRCEKFRLKPQDDVGFTNNLLELVLSEITVVNQQIMSLRPPEVKRRVTSYRVKIQ